MRDITVHTRRVDAAVTLRLEGELDMASVGQVERAMRTQEETGCRELVLDLRDLHFIDSTGLRLVLSAHARASEGGWRFAVLRGPDRVHRVFQVAGLEARLPFVEGRVGDGDPD